MNRILTATAALMLATPAFAAGGEAFFSLRSTEFVVTVAFLLFIGVLIYFKVPGLIGAQLDKRAAGIKKDLDDARALHDEARSILSSYERKQKDVAAQAERIVEHAKEEARLAAEQAKVDLKTSIARRLAAAEGQIASAEAAALKEVRDQAVIIAVGAARDVIAKQMTATDGNKLIDEAIAEVEAKLH